MPKAKIKCIFAQPDLLYLQVLIGKEDHGGLVKRFNEARIPSTINLQVYGHGDIKSSVEYDSHAVVKHCGDSLQEGHYITFTRLGEQRWCINDKEVRQSSMEEAQDHDSRSICFQPYLVFYALRDVQGSLPGTRENTPVETTPSQDRQGSRAQISPEVQNPHAVQNSARIPLKFQRFVELQTRMKFQTLLKSRPILSSRNLLGFVALPSRAWIFLTHQLLLGSRLLWGSTRARRPALRR